MPDIAQDVDVTCNDLAEETFGRYIRKLRVDAGIHTRDLAARLGVDVSHLYRVEVARKAPLAPDRWGPLFEIGADEHVLTMLSERYFAARCRLRGVKARPDQRRRIPAGHPGSLSWNELSWEEDAWCQYVVAQHPDGLSQDEVAALTGWSPYLVEQLTQAALAKLREHPTALEALDELHLVRQSRDSIQMPPLSAQR